MDERSEHSGSGKHAVIKKSYETPRLIVYGDLARLTMNKNGAKADGTGAPSTKAGGT